MASYDWGRTMEQRLEIMSTLVTSIEVEDYRIRIITWEPLRFRILGEHETEGLQDTKPYFQYTDDQIFTTDVFDLVPPLRPVAKLVGFDTPQGSGSSFGASLSEQDFAMVQKEARQRRLECSERHREAMVRLHDLCLRRKGFVGRGGADVMLNLKKCRHSLLVDYHHLLASRHGDKHCTRVKRVLMSLQKELKVSSSLMRKASEKDLRSFAILDQGCSDATHLARDAMRRLYENDFSPDVQMLARLQSARDALHHTVQTIKKHLESPLIRDHTIENGRDPSIAVEKSALGGSCRRGGDQALANVDGFVDAKAGIGPEGDQCIVHIRGAHPSGQANACKSLTHARDITSKVLYE